MSSTPVPTWRRPAALLSLGGAVLFALGMAATPWEDDQTARAYHDALAAHPGRAQVAALLLHFGYMLLAAGAFALIGALGAAHCRSWWLRIGAVLTVLGATTMPGLLVTDAYDLALAQELPRDTSVKVTEAVGEFPLAAVLGMTAMLGLIVGSLLLWTAAWRTRLIPGRAAGVILAGWLIGFATVNPVVMVAGAVVFTIGNALAARALWRDPAMTSRATGALVGGLSAAADPHPAQPAPAAGTR